MATKKSYVQARYPDAVCVGSVASFGIGSVKVYAVWTSKNGRRIGGALTAREAWSRAASLVTTEGSTVSA